MKFTLSALGLSSLVMLSACSTVKPLPPASDPARPTAWKIEPLMSVTHSGSASKGYYTLGRYHDGMRAWDKSIEAYQKSIAADPTHVEAHNALGAALVQRRRLDEAAESFRRALAINANLSHVQSNLGYSLILSGRPEAAVAALKVAVRLEPDNVTARENLRTALAQWDLARGLEPAIVVSPSRAEGNSTPSESAVVTVVATSGTTPSVSKVPAGAVMAEARDAGSTVTVQAPSPGSIQTPLPMATTIEVMAPITSAQVAAPLTSTVVAAAVSPAESYRLATVTAPLPSTISDAITVVPVRATIADGAGLRAAEAITAARQQAQHSSRLSMLPMEVISVPTLPAMIQSTLRSDVPAWALAPTPVAPLTSAPASSLGNVAIPTDKTIATSVTTPKASKPALDKKSNRKAVSKPQMEVSGARRDSRTTRHMAHWLTRRGQAVTQVGGHGQRRLQDTVLYYQAGHADDARRLARTLPFKVQLRAAGAMPINRPMHLMLGTDWQRSAACTGNANCAMPATMVAMATGSSR